MILGYFLISLALAATIAAAVTFTLSRRAGKERLGGIARRLALLATAAVVGASGYLVYLFATHQFQVAYVAEYSAKRSSDSYLFAAFWGGQEGSILLWAFFTALLGATLAFRAGGKEAKVWPIFAVIQSFLMGLLLLKCPFALGTGPTPLDGKGLNPLLENPWMVIHPPILFIGFSSLAIPYVWTVYGLLYRDWDGWVRRAFSWALFSFSTLGFGVALGGYWAYETLGWGGFWAWDPVENSSLVPWLFTTALLHGIAIQRANGGYKITNLLLGFLPFAFMFYGTFLTRTGLLGDFSVHSFSSLGADGYWVLLTGVLTTALVPLAFLIGRFRQIPKPPAYERVVSREFGFFLASSLLGIIGLITAVGMSAPLFTKLWVEKGASAQPGFYNQAAYPLAILLTVGMAATPYFAWRATDTDGVLKRLFPAYAAAIVLTLGLLLLGARDPWMLLLFAASLFAVLTNVLLIVPRLRKREARRTVGGFVAHVGAGLVLVGVACLVAFGRDQRVALVKGQTNEVMGYRLTYLGMSTHPFDRYNNTMRIKVEKNGRTWEANPRYYLAPWGGKMTPFANPPAIFPNIYAVSSVAELFPWNNPYPWGDLYIAHFRGPFSVEEKSPNNGLLMPVNGETTYGDYTLKFLRYEFVDEAMVREAIAGGPAALAKLPEIRVRGLIDVTYKGETTRVGPEFVTDKFGQRSVPAALPGTPNAVVSLDDIQEMPGAAGISTTNLPDPGEVLQIDVSTKPMIWLVWLGTVLYTLGGTIAYRRRAVEAGLLGDTAEDAPAPAPDPQTRPEKRRQPAGRRTPEPARASVNPRR